VPPSQLAPSIILATWQPPSTQAANEQGGSPRRPQATGSQVTPELLAVELEDVEDAADEDDDDVGATHTPALQTRGPQGVPSGTASTLQLPARQVAVWQLSGGAQPPTQLSPELLVDPLDDEPAAPPWPDDELLVVLEVRAPVPLDELLDVAPPQPSIGAPIPKIASQPTPETTARADPRMALRMVRSRIAERAPRRSIRSRGSSRTP
jgi:hypothetical protein